MEEKQVPRKLTAKESNQLLLERIEITKRLKSPVNRIEQWRGATEEERGRAGRGLMRRASAALRGRKIPFVKPPLSYPRVPDRRPN